MLARRTLLGAAALAPLWGRAASDASNQTLRAAPVDISALPAPGTYKLARISSAPTGAVLDTQARTHQLNALLRGRISIVSFIYTYCRDPEGCPQAWAALEQLRDSLGKDELLARRAQIVSISFDPSNDTPQTMRLFAGAYATDPRVRWQFLTTASVPALLPLLDGFGQDVSVEMGTDGKPTRTLNHLLKLFLVDARLQVREIYSIATLAPQALLNDMQTLRMEESRA